jgi:class 3 adenylate cyclase/tetratricopeptide (TPR) repeat protein
MATSGRRERKVVTVLFADLVGFTSRAETLDPEDVEALLSPYHARLSSELERHGGRVEKFIGDAVMAVFGAPIAHEDDPERAVRAALAIRDWIRDEGELEVRIGVNSGEALVSLQPSPGAERGLVAGDVVNTASRLQTEAPVNGILVGEATYRATSRVIKYDEAPAVQAKGKSLPIQVWEPVEARSRVGSEITRRPRTPLVGRGRELVLLTGALARVREERSPHLLTLSGVPGIGKSRLVIELFSAIEAQPDLIYWRQGRCLPYGEGRAFSALGEIVKAHAGILEGEPDEQVVAKLRNIVDEAVPAQAEADWVLRRLRPLVGLTEAEDTGGDPRTESFAAWRRFFEGLAELDPLVLVFEDLHWADDGLLDFIDHLVDWAVSVPILVLATARPELLTRRPNWGGGKTNATTISLSPLSEQETAALVHDLLERAVLPAEVQAVLLERAAGNPLYAEEFARIALERGTLAGGAADLPLPESVQGLIAARLDGLAEEEKALVQNASVIGKVFWLGAVTKLDGAAGDSVEELLHGLERKQFVQRVRRSSIEGDRQYAFMHTLVRDVAYGQIPRADRTEKHRRAAAWLESLGRPEEYAELRAHHYLSALDALPAGAESADLRRSARLSLRAAGDHAASLHAFDAAIRDYDRAVELWPADDPERPRLLLAAAEARSDADEWDPEELSVARDALLALGDRSGAARAEILRAEAFWNLGRGDDVVRSLERTVELAGDLPLSEAKARVWAGLYRLHWLANRQELASQFEHEALRMADELGLRDVRALILSASGARRTAQGDRGGLDDLEESITIFEQLRSSAVQRPYNNIADGYFNLGELTEAAAATRRMKEAWKPFASDDMARWADSQETRLLYMAGRWDEAEEIVDRWIADAQLRGHYLESAWRWFRGRILLARGDWARAAEESARGLEHARKAADAQMLIPALGFHARVLWESREPAAEDLARKAVDACRSSSLTIASDWFPELAVVLSGLDRSADVDVVATTVPTPTPWRDGAVALGHGELRRAAEIFEQMGARPFEAEARVLAARQGLDSDLPKATEFFAEVGASAYLREAEELLANSRSA